MEEFKLIGKRIREARCQAGLTQYQLAKRTVTDVTVKELKEIEGGTGNPTLADLAAIAYELGLNLKDLFLPEIEEVDNTLGNISRVQRILSSHSNERQDAAINILESILQYLESIGKEV